MGYPYEAYANYNVGYTLLQLGRCNEAIPYLERAQRLEPQRHEPKDALKRRIEEASKFVPLEQLCLSPQCGFSSTVEGNALSYEEQVAKLRLVVETAREVWGSG